MVDWSLLCKSAPGDTFLYPFVDIAPLMIMAFFLLSENDENIGDLEIYVQNIQYFALFYLFLN